MDVHKAEQCGIAGRPGEPEGPSGPQRTLKAGRKPHGEASLYLNLDLAIN